jgi:glutathione S-transferase
MRVYGTVTSPFVRRVRAVAHETGEPVELIDVLAPEGQAALRALTPLWKVPTVELDGRVLWESSVIVDELLRRPSSFRATCDVDERMTIAAIDDATLCLVRLFYLQRDGLDVTQPPYLVKERARATSTLQWLHGKLRGPWLTQHDAFGRAELALATSLAWIEFRALHDVTPFAAFRAAHADRPSLATTAIPS